jgi:hypothetical protein
MTLGYFIWSSRRESVGEGFIVDKTGEGWRIYESVSEETGKVVRRYDPEAGPEKGLPATFPTKTQAVGYVKRWCITAKTTQS